MNIVDLLSPNRVVVRPGASSKKRVLELLSEYLASATTGLTATEIFDTLIARERLGSTGLGHGVAIPHSRIAGINEALGAVLRLEQGVDYDALDGQPVDLLFALIVPEKSTEKHLEILSQLAEMFSNEQVLTRLRSADNAETLLRLFKEQTSSHAV